MAHTTQLVNSQKPAPRASAQVIALDPRVNQQVPGSKKHIRVLQLTNLLSRSLEVSQIIETFMAEINNSVEFCGYRFRCADGGPEVEQGITDGFKINYRLKIKNRQLGEITFFKLTNFNNRELGEFEDLLGALIYPVKNAMMYQVALKSAYRDPLTGLNNRTSMEKSLPRDIALAKRHKQSMAILVMDLDGFKFVNDSCGHDAGDQVLREVGRVISEEVRHTDLVYRYGGDEFVGGLTQTTINGAIDVSERIRKSVDELDLSAEGIRSSVQISIGITLVRHSDSFKTAFKRADKALYHAKMSGKNQIIIC